ncbi:L-rhamnose mutarotase [Natrarchaeobius sp. A-rgal3]|uniref:L-rhamnose mutarotase n=1 Tax=Natrarchaeobius versutus TaxID=1679078 RepID=UPI00350F8521
MARIAFHLRIQEGKREEYREEHENVPEALEEAYLDSGAGLETYSVFEDDGHVFGYMELADQDVIEDVMENSQAQADWGEVMDPILEDDADIWMDEVYRMI